MKMRILLAESDENVRESWASALEGERFEVEKAEGMREALYRFCMQAPDLMVCALEMPPEDGLRFIGLMKQFNSRIPLVVLTSDADTYVPVMRTDFDLLLKKPVELAQLIGALKLLVAHWRPEFLQEPSEAASPEPFQMSPRGGGRHYQKKVSLHPKRPMVPEHPKAVV